MPLWNPYAGTAAIAAHAALPIVHQDAPGLIAAKIQTGTYAGNNTDNRAIPHGLGVTPTMVNIGSSGTMLGYVINTQGVDAYATTYAAVTGWDSTNFYVRYTSVNLNNTGNTYTWVALG